MIKTASGFSTKFGIIMFGSSTDRHEEKQIVRINKKMDRFFKHIAN